jgi:2-amino-4-hydroxy-6-hydroxymethyldihydropteridine diphosphokinase
LKPATAFIALGSNLQDPAAQVRAGMAALARLPETRVTAQSSLYRSAPAGYADQPDFVNAVAAVETTLAPHALLDALLAIERHRGRVREFRNAPRTLDLDVLLYGDLAIDDARLTIPHPRLHERAFVLVPLAEIAPDCRIPGRGAVADLLPGIDAGSVTRLAEPA